MRLIATLTLASLKMFFRQREAIIWTFLLPLFMIGLFSFVKFDGVGTVSLGIAVSPGAETEELVRALYEIRSLKVTTGTAAAETTHLHQGDRDAVLLIPGSSTPGGGGEGPLLLTSVARPAEGQLAALLVQRVLDEALLRRVHAGGRTPLRTRTVTTRTLTYIDFLLPGVLSMSIMQMGIFGVAFGFVSLKKRGILRRLSVTPVRPSDFIIAQVSMRLIVVLIQVGLMIGVGVLLLDLHFVGRIADLLAVAVLGAVVFLGIGFLLAGISKGEDQVAPLANIITLPMILLSGVFFSRVNLPVFVHTITGFLPLTYLADAMRGVAIEGLSLFQIWPDLLGLGLWSVITCALAIRFFRWE